MSHAPMTPDDPRLTAYVLGELEPAEAARVEIALAGSAELRAAVEEIRGMTSDLFAALQSEETPAEAKSFQESSWNSPVVASAPNGTPARRGRGRFLAVNVATLLILAGVVVGLQSGGEPMQPVATTPSAAESDTLDRLDADFALAATDMPRDLRELTREAALHYEETLLRSELRELNKDQVEKLQQLERLEDRRQRFRESTPALVENEVLKDRASGEEAEGRQRVAATNRPFAAPGGESGGAVGGHTHSFSVETAPVLAGEPKPTNLSRYTIPMPAGVQLQLAPSSTPHPGGNQGGASRQQNGNGQPARDRFANEAGQAPMAGSGLAGSQSGESTTPQPGGQQGDGQQPGAPHVASSPPRPVEGWTEPSTQQGAPSQQPVPSPIQSGQQGQPAAATSPYPLVANSRARWSPTAWDQSVPATPQPGNKMLPVDPYPTAAAGSQPATGPEPTAATTGEPVDPYSLGVEANVNGLADEEARSLAASPNVDYYQAAPLGSRAHTLEWKDGAWNVPEQQPYYAGHRFMFLDDFGTIPNHPVALQAIAPNESYAPVEENDFTVPQGEDALSTFSLDVDTASYSNVRRFLTQHQLPPPSAVRLEELVNYFDYDLPQPEGDEPFSVTLEAASCPWNPLHRLVRIGLQGREIDMSKRPLTRLVFLLDVSGSMSDANKLPLVKDSMKLLVDQLGENDRIAIVTYSDTAELKLDTTPGDQKETILQAIDSLNASGSTNGAGGIQLAYEVAGKHFLKEGANRVILCTDGDFNVGVSSDDELVKMIEEKRKSGVFLSVLGYGMGNLKDSKLEGLADKGNGTYGYIDDLEEANKVFVEELTGTLYTIAKDVKLQVEFNPAKVGAYRLLGYENRTLAAEDFNNDAVDAGEMGAGHSVTALYEIMPKGGWATEPAPETKQPAVDELRYQSSEVRGQESGEEVESRETRDKSNGDEAAESAEETPAMTTELLTVKLRYKEPEGDQSVKQEFPLQDEPQAASKDLQWAAAVTGFGLLLRNSQYAAGCNWDLVLELADASRGDDESGRREEFIDLARQARALWEAVYSTRGPRPQLTSIVAPATEAPRLEGVVAEVSREKFVVITIGADKGLAEGATLTLYRPAEDANARPLILGEVRIVGVLSDRSIGEWLQPAADEKLSIGDRVTNQL